MSTRRGFCSALAAFISFFLIMFYSPVFRGDTLVFFENGQALPVHSVQEEHDWLILKLLAGGTLQIKKTHIIKLEQIESGSMQPYKGVIVVHRPPMPSESPVDFKPSGHGVSLEGGTGQKVKGTQASGNSATNRLDNDDLSDASVDQDPAEPAGGFGGTISFSPSASEVIVGEKFSVDVLITGSENVAHVPFHLSYDPNVLTALDVRRGDFFDHATSEAKFLQGIDERNGRIVVGISLLAAEEGITGNGTLLTVDFLAKEPGISPLFFQRASVRVPGNRLVASHFENTQVQVSQAGSLLSPFPQASQP